MNASMRQKPIANLLHSLSPVSDGLPYTRGRPSLLEASSSSREGECHGGYITGKDDCF